MKAQWNLNSIMSKPQKHAEKSTNFYVFPITELNPQLIINSLAAYEVKMTDILTCGEHGITSRLVESLCCTPETNWLSTIFQLKERRCKTIIIEFGSQ